MTHTHTFAHFSRGQTGAFAKRQCPGGVDLYKGTVKLCECGYAEFWPDDMRLQHLECKLIVEPGPLERTAVW